MNNPILSLENVTFSYNNKTIVKEIDFSISQGAFVGLVGPNGGGKTTLIKMILGLLKPDEGTIKLFNQPINEFTDWSKIGFVSQKANTFNKGFPATVFEVVAMGLTARIGYFKFFTKKHRQQVITAIKQVGMEDYVHENIGNLSGGQQQRVFIARALVSQPKLIILDEPTVGIDVTNVERFYQLLVKLQQEQQITLLLVSHDLTSMRDYVTEMIGLNQTIYFHGPPEKYVTQQSTT